jgi:hypothetical protein
MQSTTTHPRLRKHKIAAVMDAVKAILPKYPMNPSIDGFSPPLTQESSISIYYNYF